MKKRKIDVAVISDLHLGTRDCRADELLAYLSSIRPDTLVLNGDIIDLYDFKRQFFPPSHFKVLRKILGMAATGTRVYYLTGNRDTMLRKFGDVDIGNVYLRTKLLLELDGRKTWCFHGDILDSAGKSARLASKFGATGYNLLLQLNNFRDFIFNILGKERFSLASRVSRQDPAASRRARIFEGTAANLTIRNHYDTVICGHIHLPKKEWIETEKGKCLYLNSGDWTENLTALEYAFKRWKLYRYNEDKLSAFFADEELKEMDMNELINHILAKKARGLQKDTEHAAPEGSDD